MCGVGKRCAEWAKDVRSEEKESEGDGGKVDFSFSFFPTSLTGYTPFSMGALTFLTFFFPLYCLPRLLGALLSPYHAPRAHSYCSSFFSFLPTQLSRRPYTFLLSPRLDKLGGAKEQKDKGAGRAGWGEREKKKNNMSVPGEHGGDKGGRPVSEVGKIEESVAKPLTAVDGCPPRPGQRQAISSLPKTRQSRPSSSSPRLGWTGRLELVRLDNPLSATASRGGK